VKISLDYSFHYFYNKRERYNLYVTILAIKKGGSMEEILNSVSSFIWGVPLVVLLFGTHLFLTFRLRFIQRYILQGIKISFSTKKEGAGDISQFGALVTALAATVGTGNIVGVATAVAAGGPGAVLWMWLTGVFGIATKYSEAILAVKYRVTKEDGTMAGGPMYALERGLKQKWLAVIFAIFTAVAAFGIGNMVQANSVTNLLHETLKIPHWISGIIITALTAIVILGGIKSIAKACEILVPFMCIFYVLGCVVLLVLKFDTIPETISLILSSAFSGQAAVGGFLGAGAKEAMRFGIARGLFSNESGLGSAPIVAAAAQTKKAFSGIPTIGPIILVVGLVTFVYSTILGWEYYGEKAIEYLFGSTAIKAYRVVWVIGVLVGSLVSIQFVWTFADIANGLMALPNLVALILLHKVIVEETKIHLWEKKEEL
jgi:AGCS family alanine or glycine:cation symporter